MEIGKPIFVHENEESQKSMNIFWVERYVLGVAKKNVGF